MAFSGWPEEALDFYDGLAADNTKTYWTQHKAVYTGKILGPMTDLTALTSLQDLKLNRAFTHLAAEASGRRPLEQPGQ